MQLGTWPVAANISLLFDDLPLSERPAAAAAVGFQVVEMWWPFPTSAPSAGDVATLIHAVGRAEVELVALNFAAGDMPAGDRGLLSDPEQIEAFRVSVRTAVSIGEHTGCRLFNALYGNRIPSLAQHEQDELALENLAYAGQLVARLDGTVLIESLNPTENPGYQLGSSGEAADVVYAANVSAGGGFALLADLYHWAAGGEDPAARLRRHSQIVGHVQVADFPGRHEPGSGDIDYPSALAELDRMNYQGVIAAEYRPATTTVDGLSWLHSDLAIGASRD
jgi:hydroxypyruvate isomerase